MNSFFVTDKEKIIKNALTCRGWTKAKKLRLLYDMVKKTRVIGGDILEIGSAFGRSCILLCLSSDKTVWSIDPHTGGRIFKEEGRDQNSFDEFLENLQKFNIKNIRVLKHTTEEVVKRRLIPSGVRFSLVFVDGMHTPDGVTVDFNFAYRKLLKGGIVIFDDYFGKKFQDYARTIDKLTAAERIDLHIDEKNGLVYFAKKTGE